MAAEGSTERGRLRRLADLDEQLLTQVEGFFELYDRRRARRSSRSDAEAGQRR